MSAERIPTADLRRELLAREKLQREAQEAERAARDAEAAAARLRDNEALAQARNDYEIEKNPLSVWRYRACVSGVVRYQIEAERCPTCGQKVRPK